MSAALWPGIIVAAGVVVGGMIAAVKMIIRVGQYLVRSEEAQSRIAISNQDISDKLTTYIGEADKRFIRIEDMLGQHGRDIAVLQDRQQQHGRRSM